MSRQVRTAHATSKGEIDQALPTADRIIVEGDDELLSYAINRAAVEPEDRVSIELPIPAASLPREPDAATVLRAPRVLRGSTDGRERVAAIPHRLSPLPRGPFSASASWVLPLCCSHRPRDMLQAQSSSLIQRQPATRQRMTFGPTCPTYSGRWSPLSRSWRCS